MTQLSLPVSTPSRTRDASVTAFESAVVDLPDEQREILSWWFGHMRNNDLSQAALAKMAGVSSSALSTAFRGKYGADLGGLCRTLEAARSNLHQSAANPFFIETQLAGIVWPLFDRARSLAVIQPMWGVKGIGKTEVAKEYKRRNNHGRTYYHRCSAGITRDQFGSSLAASMGVSCRHSWLYLRDRIVAKLALGQRLLVIDEFHEIFVGKGGKPNPHAILTCEAIREIYDLAQCGVATLGTKSLVTNLHSADNAAALEQFLDRALEPEELPDKPVKEDAAEFCRRFGLDPEFKGQPAAASIVAAIFKKTGVRKLTLHLRAGAVLASQRGEEYRWPHFVAAHQNLVTNVKDASKP